jgi:phosphofructokinase-like protein
MRVGILTGGGDCPGLNAVIRAVVRVGVDHYGHQHVGILHGWQGLMRHEIRPMPRRSVRGILHTGGTILRSSRVSPYHEEGGPELVAESVKRLGLDGLVVIGGEGTLSVATLLHQQFGLPVVGVPKTIDNDIGCTDSTFGFSTAVEIAVDAIDRLHTTAESHDRVIVVEVMGRHVGWIATHAGIAGGADFVLVPDHPRPVDDVIRTIKARHDRGAEFSIIVVAEGYHLEGSPDAEIDEFGHERLAELDVGERLAMLLEARTGFETRSVVLGHLQRGGSPNAYDRLLATRFGAYAAKLVDQRGFGQMASVSGNRIVDVPLAEAVKELKRVPDALYAVCDRLSSVPGGP